MSTKSLEELTKRWGDKRLREYQKRRNYRQFITQSGTVYSYASLVKKGEEQFQSLPKKERFALLLRYGNFKSWLLKVFLKRSGR